MAERWGLTHWQVVQEMSGEVILTLTMRQGETGPPSHAIPAHLLGPFRPWLLGGRRIWWAPWCRRECA